MIQHEAEQFLNERQQVDEYSFVELRVWLLPKPVPGSAHMFKYRLAYVVNGTCVLRYDNEFGKGDHRHLGDLEVSYEFKGPERLLKDFWADVDRWRGV